MFLVGSWSHLHAVAAAIASLAASALNHRSGVIRGVAAVYKRHSYAEKRAALDLWGQHVANLVPASALGSPVALSKAA
jgi:hypothetical protein